MGQRRSAAETLAAVEEVKRLVAGGMTQGAALKKANVSESVFRRHQKKKPNGAGIVRGSVRADQLPPRPKKGGKRTPRPVDMQDVASVAARISKLDKKIREAAALGAERKQLAAQLMKLLRH